MNPKRPRVTVVLIALVLGAAAAALVFPLGCTVYDAPPGFIPPEPECPAAATILGFFWPNIFIGLVLSPVFGLLVAMVVGRILWRRYVPSEGRPGRRP